MYVQLSVFGQKLQATLYFIAKYDELFFRLINFFHCSNVELYFFMGSPFASWFPWQQAPCVFVYGGFCFAPWFTHFLIISSWFVFVHHSFVCLYPPVLWFLWKEVLSLFIVCCILDLFDSLFRCGFFFFLLTNVYWGTTQIAQTFHASSQGKYACNQTLQPMKCGEIMLYNVQMDKCIIEIITT